MLFDPVISSSFGKIEHKKKALSPNPLCFHCYKKIEGKIYYHDDLPFDRFCWQFRYILFPKDKDDEEKRILLQKALEKLKKDNEGIG